MSKRDKSEQASGQEQQVPFADKAPETQRERWAKYGANVVLTCVIVIVLAGVAVWGAGQAGARADLTVGHTQSLKPQTVNILHDLKQPIKLVSLYARLKPSQVGQDQDFYTPVVDLLQRYHEQGRNVEVEVIDPVADPAKLDGWLGEVKRKYAGNIKSYQEILTDFPKTLDQIKKLASDEVTQMQALRDLKIEKEEQADTINEAFGTVRAFPVLLNTIDAAIKQELEKKIPDYKGQVENVQASLGTFSRQVGGVGKNLETLQKDTTAPQQARDYAEKAIPRFQQLKKLADDTVAKIKGLGELKLDEVRRQIVTEDESGNTAIRSIAVEGDKDFRLINFSSVWKSGQTTGLSGPATGPNRLRFSGEQQLTAAILSLEQSKKTKVAFVRTGGAPLASAMFGGDAPFSDIAERLRSYNFDVVEKDLSGQWAMQMMSQGGGMAPPEPTDEDIRDAVWVVFSTPQMGQFGPQPPSPEVSRKLLEHLGHGGSAMFLFDVRSDNLSSVLHDWGVDVRTDVVAVHESISGPDEGAEDFIESARRQPPIFVINQYGDSPVTRTLQTLDAAIVPMLPVETHAVPGLTIDRILPVPQDLKTWGESDISTLGRGRLPTFDPPPAGNDLPPPLWSGAVVEKHDKGRLVVIGSLGFAGNGLLELNDPKLERSKVYVSRFPGNGELFTNSVFWLAKMDDLIALSPSALDTSRIRPIPAGVLQFWRVGVLLIGLPLLAIVAGLSVYQARRD